jgi:Tol biopolymer transport system component
MTEYRDTLERELDRLQAPRIRLDELARRRERKHRNQRIRAGVLGAAVAIALGWWGLHAMVSISSVPADDPSLRLGIFADVRGWIAYEDQDSIYAMDPLNPDSDPILLNVNGGTPVAWSSDGTKLLVARGQTLFVDNADGRSTRLIGSGGPYPAAVGNGSFSPDGSQVIYGGYDHGDRAGIYVQDADGSSSPQLLYRFPDPKPNPTMVSVSTLAVSADSSRIAYFEQENDDTVWDASGQSLWVMNADGTDRHQIARTKDLVAAWPGHLAWSPDGTRLAFLMGTSIYVVNADGSGLARVVDGARYMLAGAYWSPDGTSIAFTTRGRVGRGIAIVRADGTGLHKFPETGFAGPWNPLVP